MVIGQNVPWSDQKARTPPPECGAESERNSSLNLDDRSQGVRLEFHRAGNRLPVISKFDRDGRKRIFELEFADAGTLTTSPSDPEAWVLSGLRARRFAQFPWIGFRRTGNDNDEKTGQSYRTAHHLATKCS